MQCISISNQRETIVAWDKNSGLPIYNSVVWQCLRGEEKCNELKQKAYEEEFYKKIGPIIDPYFSTSGLNWILNHFLSSWEGKSLENILAGTIDTWLIWKLKNGKVHATDYINTCRTLLFNIHKLSWDRELCAHFDILPEILPQVRHSDQTFGDTNAEDILDNPVPICGVMGDSHAALFAQGCYKGG